jgi:hypothetical protein
MSRRERYWQYFKESGNPILYIAYKHLSQTNQTFQRDTKNIGNESPLGFKNREDV